MVDCWWKLKAALLFQRFVFIHDVLIFSFLSSVESKHSDSIKQIYLISNIKFTSDSAKDFRYFFV